jgi:hypothetical protein
MASWRGALPGQVVGTDAKSPHKGHDREIARLDHYPGLDLPDCGDADAGQDGKPLLGYPGTLPALAELAGEQGSLRKVPTIRPASSAAPDRQLTLLDDKLIAV